MPLAGSSAPSLEHPVNVATTATATMAKQLLRTVSFITSSPLPRPFYGEAFEDSSRTDTL